MRQEFLKVQDYWTSQPASFQAVGDGTCIACERTAFEMEKDDAKD
jgi:hypothetical protein